MSTIDQKIEDEEAPEKLGFGRKMYAGKANPSRNENHCHPQDGQIKLSKEKKGCRLVTGW